MAAPTFIGSASTAVWNSSTTPRSTGTVAALSGDRVAAVATCGYGDLTERQSISGTGVTLTLSADSFADQNSETDLYTGTVAASGDVSAAIANTAAFPFGGAQLVFRASDGFGAPVEQVNGGLTLNITTVQDDSAIVVVIGDWNAIDPVSRVWTTVNSIAPTSGNGYERYCALVSGQYAYYVAYYPNAGAAGAKTVGIASGVAGTKPTIIAIEVKGSSGPPPPSEALMGQRFYVNG